MATRNRKISSPNIPVAPVDYQQRYMDQYSSVLRLYHNQIANSINAPLPVGSFYDTTTQTNPVADAVNIMQINSTYQGLDSTQYAIKNNSPKIYIAQTGVYNIQFSAQIDMTGGGNSHIHIWPRINSIDVPYSASKVVIAGPNDEKVAAWNWVLTLAQDDYLELAWSSPSTSGVVPGIPSVIVTVTWVCNINS
jgi:hypothetical protein